MANYDERAFAESLSFTWSDNRPNCSEYGKFLVFREPNGTGTLVAGCYAYHDQIPLAGSREKIVAVGKFDYLGFISDWESLGYRVKTPEPMRDPITKLFEKNVDLITRNWYQKR